MTDGYELFGDSPPGDYVFSLGEGRRIRTPGAIKARLIKLGLIEAS